MGQPSSHSKKNTGIAIDYVGDGVYTAIMIRGDEFIPVRSSEDLVKLLDVCLSKVGRKRVSISESVRLLLGGMENAPKIGDLHNFVLE
jgi:hypothetical protein